MKKTSPTYPSIAMCLIGATSVMTSAQVGAFQLGQIQSASRLGEPLAAQINVMMSPRETLLGTELVVLPDFDYRNDPVMQDALRSISAKLVKNQYGQHYIALTSTQNLNVPVLAFRLKASNGDNILIQRYSLSPPAAIRPRAQSATRSSAGVSGRRRTMTSAAPTIPASSTQPPSISGGKYGPVKGGDTLWKIATKVVGRDQAGAILNELFELNPHAFINGDINKLKQGVTLTLPTIEGIAESNTGIADSTSIAVPAETPPATTATPDLLEDAIEESAVAPIVESIAIDTPATAEEISSDVFEDSIASIGGDGQSTTQTDVEGLATAGAKPLDWRAENPELSAKLAQLSDKYAALRARYAEQAQTNSIAGKAPSESSADTTAAFEEALAVNLIDEAVLDPNRVTVSIEKAKPSTATGSPEPMENTVTSEAPEYAQPAPPLEEARAANASRFELPYWAIMVIGLGLLLSAAGYFVHRARLAARREAEQLQRSQKDNSLKEELAKKAQHRISMEDEVERMLHAEVVEEDGDEIEKTMQLHVDELMSQQTPEPEAVLASAEEDAQSRIDASISHGRYSEAEDLLREVIRDYPRNFNAKLRLAEVFYITEKISDFVAISQDIHAHHRPEISDEDWRRVMRMGKMIAPEEPPFSGPQSIMDDVSAG